MSNLNNGIESYIDQIEYYKAKVDELEQNYNNDLEIQNKNLRQQNKQLLISLMDNLTKVNKSGSVDKKRKRKSRCLDSSGKRKSCK